MTDQLVIDQLVFDFDEPATKDATCSAAKGSAFCESIGLDYVSCSPFRIPVARLAAAQAVLSAKAHYVPAGG
jgi:hypothetical protein